MPYGPGEEKPYPTSIKNLKLSARNKWVQVFNSVYAKNDNNEENARMAAWKVVKDKFGTDYMKESFKSLYYD